MTDRDIVNTSELIQRLAADGVGQFARQTITHWTRLTENPMPVYYQGKQGQSNKYDYDEVLDWLADRAGKSEPGEWTPTDAAALSGYEEERTRLMRAKAELAEMEAAEKAGRLVSAEEMRAVIYASIRNMRQAFSALPDRLAAELAAETDEIAIVTRLREEIAEVMTSLRQMEQRALDEAQADHDAEQQQDEAQ